MDNLETLATLRMHDKDEDKQTIQAKMIKTRVITHGLVFVA
jgi:hypothetical protein